MGHIHQRGKWRPLCPAKAHKVNWKSEFADFELKLWKWYFLKTYVYTPSTPCKDVKFCPNIPWQSFMKFIDRSHVTSSNQRFSNSRFWKNWQEIFLSVFQNFESFLKTFTYDWKMIGLAVFSYSMDEIMKMYGGVFLYSNPLGSYEQFWVSRRAKKTQITWRTEGELFTIALEIGLLMKITFWSLLFKVLIKTDLLAKNVWKSQWRSWHKMPSKLLGWIGFLYKVVHKTGRFPGLIFTIFFCPETLFISHENADFFQCLEWFRVRQKHQK